MASGPDDTLVVQFMSVTGTEDAGYATRLLEASGWNLQTAVDIHIGSDGGGGGGGGGMPP